MYMNEKMKICRCNGVKKKDHEDVVRCLVLLKSIDKSTHASGSETCCGACGSKLIVQRSAWFMKVSDHPRVKSSGPIKAQGWES